MRNAKNKSKSTVQKTVKKDVKDHLENDFENCDKLILNFGGKKVVLDKERQKELLEFVMALSRKSEPNENQMVYLKIMNYVINNIKTYVQNTPRVEIARMALKIIDMKREEN